MGWKVISLIIATTFAALFAVISRYEIVAGAVGGNGTYGSTYRLDHWTGDIAHFDDEYGKAVPFIEIKPQNAEAK